MGVCGCTDGIVCSFLLFLRTRGRELATANCLLLLLLLLLLLTLRCRVLLPLLVVYQRVSWCLCRHERMCGSVVVAALGSTTGGGRARLWRPPDWLQGRPLPPPRWRGDRCILLGHGGSSSSSNRSSISLLTAIITAITVINVVVATFLLQRVFKERLRHGCGLLDVSVAGAAACGAGGTKVEREVAQRGGKL